MTRSLLILLLLSLSSAALPVAPPPLSVAVIYNSNLDESKKLAASYAVGRGIPERNLVGLDLPDREEISRDEYTRLIRDPLIAEFDRRDWWRRQADANGNLVISQARIHIAVCIRGVPLKIKHPDIPNPKNQRGEILTGPELMAVTGSAAVDSELTVLGLEGLPLPGPLNNPYFEKETDITAAALPILLVGRIDGPTWQTCHRMIRDALAVEKTGLWGAAVVDIANKIAQGDQWLEGVAASCIEAGMPTLVDRFSPTLPSHFPLADTAIYFGWYDWNVSGPFVNPDFRFKPGAVAIHLHSFSAVQLRDPTKNWSAPLLEKGAAATIGNVYEPLLAYTHHFDILTDRLLKGYSLVEAAYMSVPSLSWQGIVLGDPLYRPFLHLEGGGEKADADRVFRALRLARTRWGSTPDEFERQIRSAAVRMKSGTMLEALGLDLAARDQNPRARAVFREARAMFPKKPDQLRMDLLIALLDREDERTSDAIKGLNAAKALYAGIPEVTAAITWLNLLDPPPPPPGGLKK